MRGTPATSARNLDLMRSHGYGRRAGPGRCLGGDYWAGREIGPVFHGDEYWPLVARFCEELKARGMGWFLTQGDCYPRRLASTRGRSSAGWGRRCGPTCPQIALFEVANESRDTCPIGMRLGCAEMAAEFHGACPEVTIRLLSAYTGHEDVAITNDYSRDPATAFTVHSYRDGHWWDKTRHIFSMVYEQKPQRRLGWQGEPAGPGSAVSAIENRDELTDGPLMAMAAIALMTPAGRGSISAAPGVKSDEGETFEQMPGFACVPSVVGHAAEGPHGAGRAGSSTAATPGPANGCSSRTARRAATTPCQQRRARRVSDLRADAAASTSRSAARST